jgi:hypothetical protein
MAMIDGGMETTRNEQASPYRLPCHNQELGGISEFTEDGRGSRKGSQQVPGRPSSAEDSAVSSD